MYNGNAVFALSAPSDIVPVVNVVSTESRLSATSIASSNWRSFTDEEESRLLKAWASLNDTMRTDQAEAEAKSNGELEGEREGEDSEVANEGRLAARLAKDRMTELTARLARHPRRTAHCPCWTRQSVLGQSQDVPTLS